MFMRANTAISTRDFVVFIPRNRVQKRNLGSQKVFAMKNFLGKLFGTDEKVDEVKGKNESILAWAREAKVGTQLAPANAPEGQQIATFAGGCFWGVELAFQRVPGVTQTSVGYTQGERPNPTYEEVCSGSTGHTEAVQMYFNPEEVTYGALIDVLLERADPTTLNRQGSDRGTQYRSGIYYHNAEQEKVAREKMREVQEALNAGTFGRPTAGKEWKIEIKPSGDFWVAEKYHQQYLSKGGRFGQAQSSAKSCKDKIRCYG